jgi:hypothetical protein
MDENACPEELRTCSPGVSPGPVKREELLCRHERAPIDTKYGRCHKSLFERSKLREGLSVWRVGKNCWPDSPHLCWDVGETIAFCKDLSEKGGSALAAIYAATKLSIEEVVLLERSSRGLCVVDEVVDDVPTHAHLRYSKAVEGNRKQETFIRDKLLHLMQNGRIYSA